LTAYPNILPLHYLWKEQLIGPVTGTKTGTNKAIPKGIHLESASLLTSLPA
jgi:hypothetical protein